LYRNKHKLNHPVVRARYGLFLGGYRSERYYWEVVVIFRKVTVVGLSVFGTAMRIQIQALVCLFVILICIVLQIGGKPFLVKKKGVESEDGTDKNTVDDRHGVLVWLELMALLVIWMTLWVSVLDQCIGHSLYMFIDTRWLDG
jgi:hypothetical protein